MAWTTVAKPTNTSITTSVVTGAQPFGLLMALTSVMSMNTTTSVTSGWGGVSKPTSSTWSAIMKPTSSIWVGVQKPTSSTWSAVAKPTSSVWVALPKPNP